MTNEELVEQIQNGVNVQDNMLLLYNQNFPLIRKVCIKYAGAEPVEDLLQVAFISLYDSTRLYNSESGKYITYAILWVKQAVFRYLASCGQMIKVPPIQTHNIYKYKKFVQDYFMEHGRKPTDEETCSALKMERNLLDIIKTYSMQMESLDAEIPSETGGIFVGDSIASDYDLETDCIDRIATEQQIEQILSAMKETLTEKQALILQLRYMENKTYREIAEEYQISANGARLTEQAAIRKLQRKFKVFHQEEFTQDYYRSSSGRYRRKNNTSSVELIVFQRQNYEKRKLRQMLRSDTYCRESV